MKKDIRYIAVDYNDPKIQNLMSDSHNAFTEINHAVFDNKSDGIFTGNENFDNIVMEKGRLMEDPVLMTNHSKDDTKFVFAKLVIRDGYYDLKGNHHNHTETVPLRFFKHIDQIMLAKKGDAVQVTGSIKTFIDQDVADARQASSFFYISVKSFGIMFGSSIRKQVKAKFEPKPAAQPSGNNDLTSLIAQASPEKRAVILAVLQGDKRATQQTNASNYQNNNLSRETHHSATKQGNSKIKEFSQNVLRQAFNSDF